MKKNFLAPHIFDNERRLVCAILPLAYPAEGDFFADVEIPSEKIITSVKIFTGVESFDMGDTISKDTVIFPVMLFKDDVEELMCRTGLCKGDAILVACKQATDMFFDPQKVEGRKPKISLFGKFCVPFVFESTGEPFPVDKWNMNNIFEPIKQKILELIEKYASAGEKPVETGKRMKNNISNAPNFTGITANIEIPLPYEAFFSDIYDCVKEYIHDAEYNEDKIVALEVGTNICYKKYPMPKSGKAAFMVIPLNIEIDLTNGFTLRMISVYEELVKSFPSELVKERITKQLNEILNTPFIVYDSVLNANDLREITETFSLVSGIINGEGFPKDTSNLL